ncbi:MAG TPA: MlaD family protein [Solirubrobacteraceae bacterium]|nr:MlaD family protein [Solirubrobacteraceae bacterium]
MSRRRLWRRHDEIPVIELQRSNPVRFGVIVLVIIAVVVFFGFTKHVPFKHGYRLKAVFSSAINIRPKSPVRIAGVNVGKVVTVKREGKTGVVTMEITNSGLPIHADATVKIRPRIFLEGNFFVDLQPGSPSAKTISSGGTIPITRTSDPVQLDQVLTALNTDTRANLQDFLDGYGDSLTRKPTAADDAATDPDVRGLTAAQALNKAYRRGPAAFRGSAIVSQAVTGTNRHDISKLVAGVSRVTSALNVHEQQLGELFVNFNTFLGSFAAQSTSLNAAVAQLPGALQNAGNAFTALNSAFPPTRAFALAIIPGVKQTPATISAALPWIDQVRALLAQTELGGVAKDLHASVPTFAKLTGAQTSFQQQVDHFSQCLTKVFLPAGNAKLQDGNSTSGVESYKEFWYAMSGLASAGQGFDGNGSTTRFLVGGGGATLKSAPVGVVGSNAKGPAGLVSRTPLLPQGTHPRFPAIEPPYKPLVRCDTQALPDFNGPLASGPADGGGK